MDGNSTLIDWRVVAYGAAVAVLSSAVVASLVTAVLGNFFAERRETRTRRRETQGMLQRARSMAAMFLEAVKAKEYDSELTISSRLTELRDLMLSLAFTSATGDLDLDEAYRALETLHIEARKLVQNSKELVRLSSDPGAWPMDPHGDDNAEYDPEVQERLETHRQHQLFLVKVVSNYAETIVTTIAAQQKSLRNRR